jgi:hypothetical protein
LLKALGDVVDVVGHPTQQIAAGLCVDVAERQAADLVLDVGPQSVHRSLHDTGQCVRLQVGEPGSAYVQALETLVDAAQMNRGQADSSQARQVALTALHQAANEVVRLAPNDPVVAKIIQGIEQEKKQAETRTGRSNERQIVWF